MKTELKMYISAKKKYSLSIVFIILACCFALVFASNKYNNPHFGKSYDKKASLAISKLNEMYPLFEIAASLCNNTPVFMQAIIFPELMRYNSIKDGIEVESLRTLYVELGDEYANFSIGYFQMKPSFAWQVEEMLNIYCSNKVIAELQLEYSSKNEKAIRRERVNRLQDEHWQLVYLAAFVSICNKIYQHKAFENDLEKMQWFATVYNSGFNQPDKVISEKIKEENFYLEQQMPGKKFRYTAIASWFYISASK